MNARLKAVKDGTGAMHRSEACWFDVRTRPMGLDDSTRQESGEIYWPFALVWNCATISSNNFDLVHLPSGFCVPFGGREGLPRRQALARVRELRKLCDWQFTQPRGPKWERAKRLFHARFGKAQAA